ncbi:MAG: hypothetical protein WCJ30_15325, partial [Deltaproteobacteria bacterium]
MSGYRFDEITGGWVVVAPARRGLPLDPALASAAASARADGVSTRGCPFCPGHESETENTLAQWCDAAGDWLVRVVHNRYPSVREDAALTSRGRGGDERPATGQHEIVIESRAHDIDLADFDDPHAARVLAACRDRARALEALPGIAAVSLFRNRGRRSGSSQLHPHAQLVATSVLPAGFALRHARAAAFAHARGGASLLDALVAREREADARIVERTARFDVFCPFASHRAYETWIVPSTPRASFAACDDEEISALAPLLTRTLRRVRVAT